MKRFFAMCAALALCAAVPMFAQTTAPSTSEPSTPPATNPSMDQPTTQGPPSSQTMTPSQGSSTAADLTGQTIYSAKGTKLGTVASMSTDVQGQQAAAVTMGRHLGMGGQTVLIPVSSLQARSNGGYTTTLSAKELKALSKGAQ